MPTPDPIRSAGAALVAAAVEPPQTPGDIIREMFPYIWQASRHLSTRKISVWLKENHNISLSQATISRALRNSPEYWRALAEKMEPAARVIAEFTETDPLNFMCHKEFWDEIVFQNVKRDQLCYNDLDFEQRLAFQGAIDFLEAHWYVHSKEIRDNCRRYIDTEIESELEQRSRDEWEEIQNA